MLRERLLQIFDKTHPYTVMSEHESEIFINVLLSMDENLTVPIEEIDKSSDTYKLLKPLLDAFQIKIFLMRLEKMTSLKITLGALMILSQHFDSAGTAVMYAYYLHHRLPANTLVTADVIATKLFPLGFFSNAQLNEIWNEQKVKSSDDMGDYTCIGAQDNLLDYLECWIK